jgi:predicted transcriptional regulator of viral defense system
MPGRAYTQLAEVANERYGFVMPDDARELGINPMTLVRMAERGQIERRGTGLYRFPLTPASRLDPYMEAALWPRGARGVLSHETALELYELSDVHPAKVHITVPHSHRVRRGVPSAYVLHHEDLGPDQITMHEGIAIVTPIHAIRQAHEASLGAALVGQAIDQGEDGGRLTKRQASALRRELGIRRGSGGRG